MSDENRPRWAHSRGPWVARDFTARAAQEIVADDGTIVAEVHGKVDRECVANGALIAAAPEMLSLLRFAAGEDHEDSECIACGRSPSVPRPSPDHHKTCELGALLARLRGSR